MKISHGLQINRCINAFLYLRKRCVIILHVFDEMNLHTKVCLIAFGVMGAVVALVLLYFNRSNLRQVQHDQKSNEFLISDRFFRQEHFNDAKISKFTITDKKGQSYTIEDEADLEALQKTMCRPMLPFLEPNVSGDTRYLEYELVFSDQVTLKDTVRTNFFKDRSYLDIYFPTDDSWIDKSITYRHDVISRYIRIDNTLSAKTVNELRAIFISNVEDLMPWVKNRLMEEQEAADGQP